MPLIVNGQKIDDAVLETEFSTIKSYYENLGNVSCCERDPEFRGYAKKNVVSRVLLAQEAARVMPASPVKEVEAGLEKLKEEYGGDQWFFARTGLTPETVHLVRHDVDVDLRVKRMIDELTDADGKPADEVLQAFYEKHIELFKTPEQVRASHILMNPSRGEDRDAAYETLRQARKQLLGGADFDALARQHSERAEDNIDLDFFKKNELAPEFEAVAFSMEIGEISPVFSSQYGYHLIKLTDRRPATPKPFDDVREEVVKHYRETLKQEKAKTLVEKLETTAVVEEVTPEPETAEVP